MWLLPIKTHRLSSGIHLFLVPSPDTNINQCSSCEPQSYLMHNPMHIFIKFPRPVHRPVEELHPILPSLYGFKTLISWCLILRPRYKIPCGPLPSAPQSNDPKGTSPRAVPEFFFLHLSSIFVEPGSFLGSL